jgi:hypothetical protein
MLPGTRVTLGNLPSLLKAPRLDAASSQSSMSELSGPVPATAGTTTAGGERQRAPGSAPSGAITVADLAELLGKHTKLD